MSGCAHAGQALGRRLKLCTPPPSTFHLPFLYQTPTLRRYYSALRDLAIENQQANPNPTPTPKTKKPVSDPLLASSTTRQYEDYVPFETPNTTQPTTSTPQPIQGDTLTGTERSAFAQLEALSNPSPTLPTTTRRHESDTHTLSLDDVLNEAVANIELDFSKAPKRPILPPTTKDEFRVLNPYKHKHDAKTHSANETLSMSQIETTIADALHAAPTDVALWQFLETNLFLPIANLNLDGNVAAAAAATATPTTPQLRRRLMRGFSRHLLLAATILRTSFPTSNMLLAILPRLKQLGPSAYALGATPNLYNQLLVFHFRKYTDLDAMASLLQEMQDNVIEPNATTLQILDHCFAFRQRVTDGMLGKAVPVFFATEKFKRGWQGLDKWRAKVEQSLSEQDVRESRRVKSEEMVVAQEHAIAGSPVRYYSYVQDK